MGAVPNCPIIAALTWLRGLYFLLGVCGPPPLPIRMGPATSFELHDDLCLKTPDANVPRIEDALDAACAGACIVVRLKSFGGSRHEQAIGSVFRN